MPIFYHPSQVDAEEERAQGAQQQPQSAIPPVVFSRLANQFAQTIPNRLNAPILSDTDPNTQPAGDQTPASPADQSSGTQQPSSDLQGLIDRIKQVQMDPKYTAELDKFAPSQAPALPATPVGFKQRFLFGLGQGLQAMANRAANQPQFSNVPQDDALSSIAAGLSGGILSGLNPGRAIQKSYLDNTLPLYYRNEMAKSQQRKAILEEAKAAGATAPERLKQLMDQLKAYGDAETVTKNRITNKDLPQKLEQEAKQRGINIDISRYKRDMAPIIEADRHKAAANAARKADSDFAFQNGIRPWQTQSAKAKAERDTILAGKQADLSNSQINRNNAAADKSRNPKSNLTTTQQAKAAAQQAWDTTREPQLRQKWVAENLTAEHPAMKEIAKLPNDGNKEARSKQLIENAWQRYKASNPNFKKEYDLFMKQESAKALSELGGDNSGNTYTPPSRVAGNVDRIKGFSWK